MMSRISTDRKKMLEKLLDTFLKHQAKKLLEKNLIFGYKKSYLICKNNIRVYKDEYKNNMINCFIFKNKV